MESHSTHSMTDKFQMRAYVPIAQLDLNRIYESRIIFCHSDDSYSDSSIDDNRKIRTESIVKNGFKRRDNVSPNKKTEVRKSKLSISTKATDSTKNRKLDKSDGKVLKKSIKQFKKEKTLIDEYYTSNQLDPLEDIFEESNSDVDNTHLQLEPLFDEDVQYESDEAEKDHFIEERFIDTEYQIGEGDNEQFNDIVFGEGGKFDFKSAALFGNFDNYPGVCALFLQLGNVEVKPLNDTDSMKDTSRLRSRCDTTKTKTDLKKTNIETTSTTMQKTVKSKKGKVNSEVEKEVEKIVHSENEASLIVSLFSSEEPKKAEESQLTNKIVNNPSVSNEVLITSSKGINKNNKIEPYDSMFENFKKIETHSTPLFSRTKDTLKNTFSQPSTSKQSSNSIEEINIQNIENVPVVKKTFAKPLQPQRSSARLQNLYNKKQTIETKSIETHTKQENTPDKSQKVKVNSKILNISKRDSKSSKISTSNTNGIKRKIKKKIEKDHETKIKDLIISTYTDAVRRKNKLEKKVLKQKTKSASVGSVRVSSSEDSQTKDDENVFKKPKKRKLFSMDEYMMGMNSDQFLTTY